MVLHIYGLNNNIKNEHIPDWLEWAREIQQLCQTGLAFSESEYDTQRYNRLTEIAAEIVTSHSMLDKEHLTENLLAHLNNLSLPTIFE